MSGVRTEECCGAVVYKMQHGELLFLVEHMDRGHFSIPKGHVEGDETEEETAVREIREETGLEVWMDTAFRDEVRYSYAQGVEKHVVFFAAEAREGEMKNQEEEVISLEWLSYEDAVRTVTYPEVREVVKHAAAYLAEKYHLRNPV